MLPIDLNLITQPLVDTSRPFPDCYLLKQIEGYNNEDMLTKDSIFGIDWL